MISLFLAILAGVVVKVVYKYIEDKDIDGDSVMVVNYVVTTLIALKLCIGEKIILNMHGSSIILCSIVGIFQAIMLVYNYLAVRKGILECGASMTTVFSSIGNMLTVLVSVFLFGELPHFLQWIGILLAFGSFFLENIDFESGIQWSFKGVLLWIALMTCLMGINYKVIQISAEAEYNNMFLFISFFLSLLLCGVVFRKKKCKYGCREILFGIIMGIPNIACSYFLMDALKTVPATIAYPVNSAGSIVVTVVICAVLFRERWRKNEICAIFTTILGVVLINL